MSIKFRRDGAVFPTSVTDGVLRIHLGNTELKHPLKLLSDEYPYDNTWFEMSNIMCYLDNGETIVVLRFDGTATKLTHDNKVIGFMKFDFKEIYSHLVYLPVGCTFNVVGNDRVAMPCSIYSIPEESVFALECIGDPEPIIFEPNENPKFCDEIVHGTRYYPSLVNAGTNKYVEDSGKYEVKGSALKITGFAGI